MILPMPHSISMSAMLWSIAAAATSAMFILRLEAATKAVSDRVQHSMLPVFG